MYKLILQGDDGRSNAAAGSSSFFMERGDDHMARPSKYDSHVKPKLNRIEAWARDGLTDEQIAHNLGIGISTYYDYKSKNKEFSDALKNGKEDIDIQVENALLKRALGYRYEEVTYEAIQIEGSPPTPAQKVKTVVKEVQPDTTAQIFWLKNRKPAEWRDKQEHALSGNLHTTQTDLTDMTPEERQARINELISRRGT